MLRFPNAKNNLTNLFGKWLIVQHSLRGRALETSLVFPEEKLERQIIFCEDGLEYRTRIQSTISAPHSLGSV